MEDLGAVVLCGGRGSRMGGDKAWLPFGDELLLQRVVRRIAPAVGPIAVVAAPDQRLPPLPAEVIVARDELAGRGPLAGLCAGLLVLGPSARFGYATACDAPFVGPPLIARLRALCRGDIAVAEVDGRLHPLAAVYATSLVPLCQALLSAGERRLMALCHRARARAVSREELLADPAVRALDPALDALTNLNTRQDYRAALARAASPLLRR